MRAAPDDVTSFRVNEKYLKYFRLDIIRRDRKIPLQRIISTISFCFSSSADRSRKCSCENEMNRVDFRLFGVPPTSEMCINKRRVENRTGRWCFLRHNKQSREHALTLRSAQCLLFSPFILNDGCSLGFERRKGRKTNK